MTATAVGRADSDPRDALVERVKNLSREDIGDLMGHLRAKVASYLGPWASQKDEDLVRVQAPAKELLALIQASFSAFGNAGWVLGAYHDSHWDLHRAFSQDEGGLRNLRLQPLKETQVPDIEAVAEGILKHLEGMPVVPVADAGDQGDGSEAQRHAPSRDEHAAMPSLLAVLSRNRDPNRAAALYSAVSTASACEDAGRAELVKSLYELFRKARESRP
jgi:hypothetical protein